MTIYELPVKTHYYLLILLAAATVLGPVALTARTGTIFATAYAQHQHEDDNNSDDDGAGHKMDTDMKMMNMATSADGTRPLPKSPFVYSDTSSGILVKVSWKPDSVNTKAPTKFTFEFLNSTTGDHLRDVSYSVHMLLDGKGVEHGHKTSAPDGVGTLEHKFDSKGLLSVMVESIRVERTPTNAVVQLDIPVVS
ncbi:hypothetical protein NTE_01065 [Candidatus Nitrososphaera evergladensis SR1]|uniref:Uncharacterized protein n=1 Tax=Candidatus Nitrososphaera evergladensis SR1 TaxID=1459636 RepID=A0A075MPJ7_9ARCH|nr:hypothetical protein [Candidatus Nitrososphaera evergladensis]AIF83138.1 hypothetical protein NTE_01065 [Candidatus Nitrososphaera evergladensis SR1]